MPKKKRVSRRRPVKKASSPRKKRPKKKYPKKKYPKRKAVWTLPDGVSNSGLQTWLSNQEAFRLKYVEGLTSKKLRVPLEFGNAIHHCIEHQWNFNTPQDCAREVCEQYYQWRAGSTQNSSERDLLRDTIELAKVTFPPYCEHWREDDSRVEWVGREEKFKVPYVIDTESGLRKIFLVGMRDGVYRTKCPTSGESFLGVFETKTKERVSETEIMDGLHADFQTMFYLVATRVQYNETPTCVKYNIIRRSGTYQRKDESGPAYARRVAQDIKTRPAHYYKRYLVELIPSDIDDFRRNTLDPTLRCFLRWHDEIKKNELRENPHPYHILNCADLIGKYGRSDLWNPIVKHNRKDFYIRSDPHPELVDSFQVTH